MRKRPLLITVLVVSISAACAAGIGLASSGGTGTAQVRKAERFDGQTIFRGIFLHEGPVAELVPVVAQLPPNPPGLEESADPLLEAITTTDPAFFDRYAAQMQSGSPVRVQEATEEAGRIVAAVSGDDGELRRMRPREDNYSYVHFYKYVYQVLYTYEYAYLFQHAAFYQSLWWPSREQLPRSALEREAVIARVTQALAA